MMPPPPDPAKLSHKKRSSCFLVPLPRYGLYAKLKAVADPGFPRRGRDANCSVWRKNLLIFAKKCMKIKEI